MTTPSCPDSTYRFRTNNFPGNCFTSRFISRLNRATLTAELGRPLARMISSILVSSCKLTDAKMACSFSFRSSAGNTPVSPADGGRLLDGNRHP